MRKRTAWFDCFSGVSGDMCLGALVDAGASFDTLKRRLRRLPLRGYEIHHRRVSRSGLPASKVDVVISPSAGKPTVWKDMRNVVSGSSLPDGLKAKGIEMLRTLFEAEGRVHGRPYNRVHLHEAGGIDTLVDIIGTLICLDLLGVETVCASPVNLGGGAVSTSHGLLPVPAPATAELMKGLPVYSSGTAQELATPTGAAIIKCLSSAFGGMPQMQLVSIGYGAGQRDIEGMPNVVRVFVGEPVGDKEQDGNGVIVMEANIDDMNPQLYGHLTERLLSLGALDVYLTPVIMKKGRPGVLVTALCPEERRAELSETLFKETTTIGLRHYRVQRTVLPRRVRTVATRFGTVRVKESRLGGEVLRKAPEYDDCRRLALKKGVPLMDVMREAQRMADEG